MNERPLNPLHIIATGAATSVGGYTAATLAAVEARVANIVSHPYYLDIRGELYKVAMAPYIEPELQGTQRFNALLNYALSDCFADQKALPASTPFVLCLPHERPTFRFEQARKIAQKLIGDCSGLRLTSQDLITQGHAAAYEALTLAQQYLTRYEFCILAGVDSYLDSATLNWLDINNTICNTDNAYGFIPGEAAACVLLCTQQTLEKHQLNSLGALQAYASACEPVHHTQGVCTGQGLSKVIKSVVNQCPSGQKIRQTICDLNGQPHRSDEYGFTLTRLNEHFDNPDNFTTPADCWGDVGAASGVLQMVLATAQPVTNTTQNALTLLWASSLHDLRGAALFQSPINNT